MLTYFLVGYLSLVALEIVELFWPGQGLKLRINLKVEPTFALRLAQAALWALWVNFWAALWPLFMLQVALHKTPQWQAAEAIARRWAR